MNKIQNKNLEQLKKYVQWEKENCPNDEKRTHVLDWAIAEILRLREQINQLQNRGK